MKREHARALAELRGSVPVAMVEAAKKLASVPSLGAELREILRSETRMETRHAIVFALSWHDDLRSWNLLLRLLADQREAPLVRGQAAEGLAYKFHRKRRGSVSFRSAIDSLITAASDPSKEVRFHAAFALGAAREVKALRVLRKLTRDGAPEVAAEARDAIQLIRTA